MEVSEFSTGSTIQLNECSNITVFGLVDCYY